MKTFSEEEYLELIREYGAQDVRKLELLFWDTQMSLFNYERCLDAIRDCRFRIAEQGVKRYSSGIIDLPWQSAAYSDLPIHFKHRLFFTDFLFFPEAYRFSLDFMDC